MSDGDSRFMHRALRLAASGRGLVEPNPLVGCVIERDGRILGEEFHEKFGGPHAEVNALAACREDPVGASVHVTLEPCCHTAKKTLPCVPRLIEAKVARVVIGCIDPNREVSGLGAAQLRAAGIHVVVGVLEAECKQMNAAYIARTLYNRPYVTMKWAASADGMIAGRAGRPVQITNQAASKVVHDLRGRCDAIAIGTNTLINDDPLLTVRSDHPPRRPIRVVLSNQLGFMLDRRLLSTPQHGPVLIYTSNPSDSQAVALRERGVEVVSLRATDNGRGEMRFAMTDVYNDLAERGVTHLLIEPGAKLAGELMERGEADRAWVFRGEVTVGNEGIEAPECRWPASGAADLVGNQVVEHLNPRSSAFYALQPSPDLMLACEPHTDAL